MNDIIIYYLLASVLIIMTIIGFIIYKIITKEHKKEIKKRKENLIKINNKNEYTR